MRRWFWALLALWGALAVAFVVFPIGGGGNDSRSYAHVITATPGVNQAHLEIDMDLTNGLACNPVDTAGAVTEGNTYEVAICLTSAVLRPLPSASSWCTTTRSTCACRSTSPAPTKAAPTGTAGTTTRTRMRAYIHSARRPAWAPAGTALVPALLRRIATMRPPPARTHPLPGRTARVKAGPTLAVTRLGPKTCPSVRQPRRPSLRCSLRLLAPATTRCPWRTWLFPTPAAAPLWSAPAARASASVARRLEGHNSDVHPDADGDAHADARADGDAHADGDSDVDADGDEHGNADGDSDRNAYAHNHQHANDHAHAGDQYSHYPRTRRGMLPKTLV